MTKGNADQVRWCERCNSWFEVPKDSNELERCTKCGQYPTRCKCNRCGHEWGLGASRYPKVCVKCKSPYYRRKRIQDRRK